LRKTDCSDAQKPMLLDGSQDSQQVELMIEDAGDDFNPPLFRSASYFPKTAASKVSRLHSENTFVFF
jgi:hypothetical protein